MNTGDDQHTVIIEKGHATEIGAFLLGAIVGAGIALLFAPATGADTQRLIRERARKLKDVTGERVRGLREDLGSRMAPAQGVVEQGRRIAAEARTELEDKLERTKAVYRAGVDAAREESRRQLGESEGNGSPAEDA
jgi:gas vesicle protein